jgi:medium-chain acyl-[acyl-carrier-protein] hydrolase
MGDMESPAEYMNRHKSMKSSEYTREFTVSSYELNPRGKARLTTVANYFQEIAYHHANELGFGYDDMKERRTMWLLSRMRIRVGRYPVWNDRIVLETWPSGVDKLFAVRDFRIRDMEGEILGTASSYWLIVDLETHRPVRPKEELERYSDIVYSAPVFDRPLKKLVIPEGTREADRHQVAFSDLDIVGHVNNVKYMEWCVNTAMKGGTPDREIRLFEINFLQEARFGDHIVIHSASGGDGKELYFSASREEDGQEVCRTMLEWG